MDSHFEEKKENIKKKVIPMESTKIPKRIIKKQLKKGVIKKPVSYTHLTLPTIYSV